MRAIPLALGLLLLAAGCGEANNAKYTEVSDKTVGVEMSNAHDVYSKSTDVGDITMQQPVFETSLNAEGVPKPENKTAVPAKIERKIIYTAHLDVVVKDFDEARKNLESLVAKNKAYVANSSISGDAGSHRSGTWTIRVPVAQSNDLRKSLRSFGFTRQDNLSSNDVTRQYYSLEIRMKNAEKLEQRLLDHLKNSGEEQTLKWEKEISRVRNTIEQMKGQLRYWEQMSAMATINLTLTEDREFKPESAPTFSDRVSSTWDGSIDAVQNFGKGVALFCVAITPWLPLILLVGIPIWWRVRKSKRAQSAEPTAN